MDISLGGTASQPTTVQRVHSLITVRCSLQVSYYYASDIMACARNTKISKAQPWPTMSSLYSKWDRQVNKPSYNKSINRTQVECKKKKKVNPVKKRVRKGYTEVPQLLLKSGQVFLDGQGRGYSKERKQHKQRHRDAKQPGPEREL